MIPPLFLEESPLELIPPPPKKKKKKKGGWGSGGGGGGVPKKKFFFFFLYKFLKMGFGIQLLPHHLPLESFRGVAASNKYGILYLIIYICSVFYE